MSLLPKLTKEQRTLLKGVRTHQDTPGGAHLRMGAEHETMLSLIQAGYLKPPQLCWHLETTPAGLVALKEDEGDGS